MRIHYQELDSERTPLGTLSLRRYEAETGERGYEIRIDGHFLMAAHGAHSERVMAAWAHALLPADRRDLRVLVGGLGAGHTLRAALDLPGVREVIVAEIGAKVIDWNRRYFSEFNGAAVDDPRARVRVADLAEVLDSEPAGFDLLLLDVDNGPGILAAEANAGLYEESGLRACRRALRPGGALAIWSPQRHPSLLAGLGRLFACVEERDTASIGRAVDEPGDVIYLAGSDPESLQGV